MHSECSVEERWGAVVTHHTIRQVGVSYLVMTPVPGKLNLPGAGDI